MKTLHSNRHQQHGFTLVELVMVIVIAGLLATYALPRFFSKDSFENRGFYTEVVNAVRYAQQLAVAVNCATRVDLTSNSYSVTLESDGANCNAPAFGILAPDPVTGQPGFTGSNTDVTISTSPSTLSFQFSALGQATADVTVSVGGYSFLLHSSTGYIEEL